MAENKISMPGAFGGLMRYDEEYKSRFMLTPVQIIGFVIAIILLVIILKIFFPFGGVGVTQPIDGQNIPIGGHGFFIPLLLNLI